MTRQAIVVGASSGIGRALAKRLSREGYRVGLVARRVGLLESLREEIGSESLVRQIDIANPAAAISAYASLVDDMGGVELVVICAAINPINPRLDPELELCTVATNVAGFTAIAAAAMRRFIEQGSGHLVSLSSLAALRGHPDHPAYNASKAYVSRYVDGLRLAAVRAGAAVTITDVVAGFVDTDMPKGDNPFWVATAEAAAAQIYTAIRRRKKLVYVTRRWRLIAWGMMLVPDSIYRRML